MERSVWLNDIKLPEFEPAKGEVTTDVLIVGGGLCGLLCGYYLKQAGMDCAVVEADRIAAGVTGNTTAKITALHGLIYAELMKKYGFEVAEKYWRANQQAVIDFERMAVEADCDFQKQTAYTYSMQNRQEVEREFSVLQRLGANVEMKYKSPLPVPFAAAVGLREQGQFHPLKFIKHIIKDLKIYEHTRVTEFKPEYAIYDSGKIKATKIIVATHFPILNKHGLYFLKLYQHRSYVLALENAQMLDGMYVDAAQKGLSFRSYGDLLLLGGGGGRTGKKCGNWEELKKFQKQHYLGSKIIGQWATQDCMSLDKIPLIGQYSPNTPNLYIATGFNKWGMTSSMAAARILCDAVKGEKNDVADIFDPNRSIWKPQLFVNVFETLANFMYPTTKRCPHLGCALKWNKYEHSWDCPCHGSRFTADGKVLDNPANGDWKK